MVVTAGIRLPVFLILLVIQSVAAESDSVNVYRDVETFSKKNPFTRFLYGLVLKPVAPAVWHKGDPAVVPQPYGGFEGKTIKNITITTLDPFGYSTADTAARPLNPVYAVGNTLHLKTWRITIMNILLFRENDPFDSLRVRESQRLIRSQGLAHDVTFRVVPAGTSGDSVEVIIRVLDKWSIIPTAAWAAPRLTGGFTEGNFLGSGHVLQHASTRNLSDGKIAWFAQYSIPNIRNSHIGARLHYSIDENSHYVRELSVERPFFSPLTQWAAGIGASQVSRGLIFEDTIAGPVMPILRYAAQEYWAGNSNRILGGNSEEERSAKVLYAARYARLRYQDEPDDPDGPYDPAHRYVNEDLYLAGVGIITRFYSRDNYIYDFGSVEDVPVGKMIGLTGGRQKRADIGRLYLGTRIAFGDYHDWGYLSSTLEYGSFFRGSVSEQGVVNANALYFSTMLKIRSWRIREFIKSQVSWGMNRFPYDSLSINDENGIRGFNSSLRGTAKIIVTIQTQSYAPWRVMGFRFGPFLTCSLGMLGTAPSGFRHSRMYPQLGLGTLVKNDFLVSGNFQFSVAYYPSIPGAGYDIFKLNAFGTTDLGFGDFTLGKPAVAAFQ